MSQTFYDVIKGWEEILFDKTRQLSPHWRYNYVSAAQRTEISGSESVLEKIPPALTVLYDWRSDVVTL